MTPNRSTLYLKKLGETVADWDGLCGELADRVISEKDDIIYVDGDIAWRFHMAPLIDGLVHDAWCPGPARTIRSWLAKMFGDSEVAVAINGDDIYSGPANKFTYE